MKCHSPAFVSHAHCLYSEATFATFSSCFFSMQTQSLLDWWRHFHGFEELRSGSAQVGAEFPTVIFYYYYCYETLVIQFIFLAKLCQGSGGQPFSPNFYDQQKTLPHDPAIANLDAIAYFFYLFILASGWRCIRIIKHSLVTEAVPAGRRNTF